MYNRSRAVEYAYKWWNGRNPQYFDFEKLGGDCTNFVSQCLHAGGIEMNYKQLGWFYTALSARSPSWTGVDEFFNFSTTNQSDFGVKTRLGNILEVSVGDVVQAKLSSENGFQHAMIVTKILSHSFKGILVTCHSVDAIDVPISWFDIKDVRFLKVLN